MGSEYDCDVEDVPWYHPDLKRHTAESMLMQNGLNGTYLLRPTSKNSGEYALSVRCEQTVKHFKIIWVTSEITFGQRVFKSAAEFVEHFKNKPLLCGQSGEAVLLKIPYPRDITEPDFYEPVTVHAELSTHDSVSPLNVDFSVNSKEGFLTKLGHYFKTWRTRWFVLHHNELSYFKEKFSRTPIRVLDLHECKECCQDSSQTDKNYVIRLDMGWRVFLMYSTSQQDMSDWIRRINWRLNANRARVGISSVSPT